jgi:mRNA-degrading endonuclease toxin of MazEF toxin-antitoxin module
VQKDPENGLEADSEIITFQIRTISGERFTRKLGEITTNQLEIVKKGLAEILTY